MKKDDETYLGIMEFMERVKKNPESFRGILIGTSEAVDQGERVEILQSGTAEMLLSLGRELQQAVVETVIPPHVLEAIKEKMRAHSCGDPSCTIHSDGSVPTTHDGQTVN